MLNKALIEYKKPARGSRVVARKALALAISGALALGILQAPAGAATITVTTTEDEGTVNGQCSLREAIVNANVNSAVNGDCAAGDAGHDEIVFDVGNNQAIFLSSGVGFGQLTITETLTITGPVPGDPTGIWISGQNATRILRMTNTVNNIPYTVELHDLTLTNGRTSLSNSLEGWGGAILAGSQDKNGNPRSINLVLDHVQVLNSWASGNFASGGGIAIRGSLTLQDSIVSGNRAQNAGGGINLGFGNTDNIGTALHW